MRNALDTSVVTCPGERRGKMGWGVSPLPHPPWHQPHQGSPLPPGLCCPQRGVLPQSPTSAGAAAQHSPGAVPRSGKRPRPGGGEGSTHKPSQASQCPLLLLKADPPPPLSCSPRFPPCGSACLGREGLNQCFFGDDSDVTVMDQGLCFPPCTWGFLKGGPCFRTF